MMREKGVVMVQDIKGIARHIGLSGILAALWLWPAMVTAAPVSVACDKVDAVTWRAACDIWPIAGQAIERVTALSDGKPLAGDYTTPPPAAPKTAVLFLIDRSDPKRSAAVSAGKELVTRLARQAHDRQRAVAIGAFDAELSILEPFDQANTDWQSGLQAAGQATELFRSVIQALPIVEATGARRKLLVVLSDGKAEDTAYSLEQAVAEARARGVAVTTIGYSERATDAPALQTLRRVAEETGGTFIEAATGTHQTSAEVDTILDRLDAGGVYTISLSPFWQVQSVTLQVAAEGGTTEAVIDIAPPEMVQIPLWRRAWLFVQARPVWVAGGVLLLVLLVTGLIMAIRRVRRRPLAFIEVLGGKPQRYPLYRTAVRIGRSPENDVVLENDTVSSFHAQIHRMRDGSFHISDLSSKNGVYIGDQKKQTAPLLDGTLIELGEIRLRFAAAATGAR